MGIVWGGGHCALTLFLIFFAATSMIFYCFFYSKKIVTILCGTSYTQSLLLNFSLKKKIIRLFLLWLGLVFLCVALLRPQWNEREIIIQHEGRNLFVALDISRSMLAQDVKPNRLECAKDKIRSLLSVLNCERVGLILFSGSSFVQCPLTTDHTAFLMFLDQVDIETISSSRTSIGDAIKTGLETFKDLSQRKNKLFLLFTDGEDFSHNLSGIKKEVRKENMHIFTIGIGTVDGAPIPLSGLGKRSGHQRDKHGSVVISRLNETVLNSIAHESGGKYIRMTNNDHDIKKLILMIHSFEKEHIDDQKVSLLEEQYHYPLGISLLCLAVEWLL